MAKGPRCGWPRGCLFRKTSLQNLIEKYIYLNTFLISMHSLLTQLSVVQSARYLLTAFFPRAVLPKILCFGWTGHVFGVISSAPLFSTSLHTEVPLACSSSLSSTTCTGNLHWFTHFYTTISTPARGAIDILAQTTVLRRTSCVVQLT